MENGYQTYQRVGMETASPSQLLLALYDGAIRFLGLARTGLERRDLEAANRNLGRVQDIIMELLVTLDMEQGEIPERLRDLYIYLYRVLLEANLEKNDAKMVEVDGHLRRLRASWRGAAEQVARQAAGDAPGRMTA